MKNSKLKQIQLPSVVPDDKPQRIDTIYIPEMKVGWYLVEGKTGIKETYYDGHDMYFLNVLHPTSCNASVKSQMYKVSNWKKLKVLREPDWQHDAEV